MIQNSREWTLRFHSQCFNIMTKKAGIKLHMTTLQTVMAAPMSFFSTTDTGVTLNRFSQDMQLLDTEVSC